MFLQFSRKFLTLTLMLFSVLSLSFSTNFSKTYAEDVKHIKLKTAWVAGQEAFMMWYAKEKGWDKELGIDVQMQVYPLGLDALNDFEVGNWFLGGLGAIPTINGAVKGNMSVIGIANDEAQANAILTHTESPILSAKAANVNFPDVYGSADIVKGNTFLSTKGTSIHYLLNKWLEVLGLTQEDVVINNMNQELAITSFRHGRGDAVTLWSPYSQIGLDNKWQKVADGKDLKVTIPVFLVANSAFANQHPDVVKNFLILYMRGVEWFLNAPREDVIKELQRYYKNFLHQDYSEYMASLEFNLVHVFDLKEQKELLALDGEKSIARTWQNAMLDFFSKEGLLSKADVDKVTGSTYITPKYMDMLTIEDLTN